MGDCGFAGGQNTLTNSWHFYAAIYSGLQVTMRQRARPLKH